MDGGLDHVGDVDGEGRPEHVSQRVRRKCARLLAHRPTRGRLAFSRMVRAVQRVAITRLLEPVLVKARLRLRGEAVLIQLLHLARRAPGRHPPTEDCLLLRSGAPLHLVLCGGCDEAKAGIGSDRVELVVEARRSHRPRRRLRVRPPVSRLPGVHRSRSEQRVQTPPLEPLGQIDKSVSYTISWLRPTHVTPFHADQCRHVFSTLPLPSRGVRTMSSQLQHPDISLPLPCPDTHHDKQAPQY